MILTKEDLHDWNSHVVTKEIFKKIKEAMGELAVESVLMTTVDETAMRAAKNEGVLEGANALLDSYEVALEEAE